MYGERARFCKITNVELDLAGKGASSIVSSIAVGAVICVGDVMAHLFVLRVWIQSIGSCRSSVDR